MIDCSHCNAPCCRHVFGPLDRGDGICRFLDNVSNRCTIYEHRPEICNTDVLYEKYFSDVITREEYDALNAAACEKLRSNY